MYSVFEKFGFSKCRTNLSTLFGKHLLESTHFVILGELFVIWWKFPRIRLLARGAVVVAERIDRVDAGINNGFVSSKNRLYLIE